MPKLVLLFLLSFLTSFKVFSCDCFIGDIESEYDIYQVAFIGKVNNIGEVENKTKTWPGDRQLKKVSFEVEYSFKGVEKNQISILTGMDEGGCGFSFQIGNTYAVFGSKKGDEVNVSLCSHTIDIGEESDCNKKYRESVLEFLSNIGI